MIPKTYNWAVIGPGNIARQFANALRFNDRANCYAVAGRNLSRAQGFANEFGFQFAFDSYAQLIQDPNVDIVYIASPHQAHLSQTLACLEQGKAVLCEKPMSVNAREAEQIVTAAVRKDVFYMEALWTRFLPIYSDVRAWLEDGHIGEIQMIQASFGFSFLDKMGDQSRLKDPHQAGGALLDMGIYPITFAQWVMQKQPNAIKAMAHLGTTGVDQNTATILSYDGGAIASLGTSYGAEAAQEAWIFGSKGRIRVPKFWCAESAELHVQDQIRIAHKPHACNGLEWEIAEVHHCLDAGLKQSSSLPWSESVAVMQIMDEIREQIGLSYPFEN